jgi:zinc protease
MRRLIVTLTLAAVFASAGIAMAETEKFNVDGVDVILKYNPNTPVVSVNFALKGGVPYYGAERAGIEVMMARAAQKGSTNYPKEQLQEVLARTGASIGMDALHDYTMMSMSCLRRDLDETWAVFADVIVRPTLDPDEVALVKERQLNDVRQSRDDPDSYLRELADGLHYAGHPYAVQPIGTVESVESITDRLLKSYHASEVTKARALVILVGDIDRKAAETFVSGGLGELPQGAYTEPVLTRSGDVQVADTRLEERDLPTNYIRGYYRAPAPHEDDFVPMTVATRILRDRLFEEVRTKRNLTYAVSSGMASRKDNYGLIYVTAVEPDTTLRVMLHEIKKMQTEGITNKELGDQLKVMITRYLMDQETNATQAAELCKFELVGAGWQQADQVVERMRNVTEDDIKRVCKKYMQNLDFVMLGDPAKWQDPLAADRPAKSGEGSLN